MPQLQNAKKALRQSKRRAAHRKPQIDELRSLRRSFRKLLESGRLDEARKMIPTLDKAFDKAVTKNLLKKNKVARIKSRMMKAFQKKEGK